jgi:Leucine-rich repeat (LRR) protein
MTLDLGNTNQTFDLSFDLVEPIVSNSSDISCNSFGSRRRRRHLSSSSSHSVSVTNNPNGLTHIDLTSLILNAMHGNSNGNVALAISSPGSVSIELAQNGTYPTFGSVRTPGSSNISSCVRSFNSSSSSNSSFFSACQILDVCTKRGCNEIDFSGMSLESASNAFETVGDTLQILKLSDNNLGALDSDVFEHLEILETLRVERSGLTSLSTNQFTHLGNSLRKLHLSGCTSSKDALPWCETPNTFSSISPLAFQNLTHLEILSLDSNKLRDEDLPSVVFDSLSSSLLELNLVNNSLKFFVFQSLSSLKTLNLGHNVFETLNSSILSGMSSLTKLYLNNNNLVEIQSGSFAHLSQLQVLWLDGNSLEDLGSGT